ncbi:MAG TPA: hypothetical protein VMV46_03870 [Thermoanaerobaculia bacterium]|nr:hypothetical protein [Thermoanaerobaculia bacterium]
MTGGGPRLRPGAPGAATAWDRARRWVGLLGQFFTAQTLTQVVGLLAGFLLVRFMPLREFALYTLATSVLGFLFILVDLGSGSSLLYFFHESRRDRDADIGVFGTAVLSLRRRLLVPGVLVASLAMAYLTRRQGFSLASVAGCTALIIVCVYLQSVGTIRLVLLRLEGRYGPSYRAEILGSVVRLASVLVMVVTGWLQASLGLLASALSAGVVARLTRQTRPRASPGGVAAARRRILRFLLPTVPSTLFFAFQAPLIVWLASTFGDTTNIAEVGALARIGSAFALFNGLTTVLFVPRLAGVTNDRTYRTRYLQYSLFLGAIGASLLAAAALGPELFLLVLGPTYAGLRTELLLTTATASVGLLQSFAGSVTLARSWTRWSVVVLALQAATLVVLVLSLSLDTTIGVLTFGLLSSLVALVLQTANNAIGFQRPHWVHWHP